MNRSLILLVLFMLLPGPFIYAQDAHEIELPDGVIIILSEEWVLDLDTAANTGIYIFTLAAQPDTVALAVYPPEKTRELYADLALDDLTPLQLLELLYIVGVFEHPLEEERLVHGANSIEHPFGSDIEPDVLKGIVGVIETRNGMWFFEFNAPPDTYPAAEPLAREILHLLTIETGICTIRAAHSNGAQLRVGPGFNRGEYRALMPAEGEILVIGKAADPDGNLWWQIDETVPEADPLWVADSTVITTGDCIQVADANAPALMSPISPGPGNDSSDTTDNAAGGSAVIPRSGTWITTLTQSIVVTCPDALTQQIAGDLLAGSITVSEGSAQIATTATTLTLVNAAGQRSFAQTAPGVYIYQFTSTDVTIAFTLTVLDADTLSGQIRISQTASGCQANAGIRLHYAG